MGSADRSLRKSLLESVSSTTFSQVSVMSKLCTPYHRIASLAVVKIVLRGGHPDHSSPSAGRMAATVAEFYGRFFSKMMKMARKSLF